jgi:hypothetical protein
MAPAFVPLSEGANELGISPNTIKRRFRSLGLTVFRDSRDLRRRLVRRADLEAAFGPPVPAGTPPRVTAPGPLDETGASRLSDN